jgi:hypothetical protein
MLLRRGSPSETIPSEQALVLERYAEAVATIEAVETRTSDDAPAAPAPDVVLDGASFPPVVDRADLDARMLRETLDSSACLMVRGLIDADAATGIARDIDRAFEAYDRWEASGGTAPGDEWYSPVLPCGGWVHVTRPWVREGGGVFTADSPRLFERWTGLVRSSGLYDAVAGCFGAPPLTSLDKGTMRRVRAGDGIEWHQDAAFLGLHSGAVNAWQCLSDTADAPGLDLVPQLFGRVVETGTRGAGYDWSVGAELVRDLAVETPVVRPRFEPGDTLLFDGRLLHRTTCDAAQRGTRYAIETWFFRPTDFPPHQQVPLAI